ncbi:hypothetical protein IscW_ISCW005420, partial [Ixodes scapularis]
PPPHSLPKRATSKAGREGGGTECHQRWHPPPPMTRTPGTQGPKPLPPLPHP